MSFLRTLRRARRASYRAGSILGDITAIASRKPSKVLKRAANKILGRKLIRRAWWR